MQIRGRTSQMHNLASKRVEEGHSTPQPRAFQDCPPRSHLSSQPVPPGTRGSRMGGGWGSSRQAPGEEDRTAVFSGTFSLPPFSLSLVPSPTPASHPFPFLPLLLCTRARAHTHTHTHAHTHSSPSLIDRSSLQRWGRTEVNED